MQQLQFESSWKKTISPKDQQHIEQVFLETKQTEENRINFTALWEAKNHKGDLLVTVLIHNPTEDAAIFLSKRLQYVKDDEVIATHTFTLPSLVVEQHTSMPWTFIFPNESLNHDATWKKGKLKCIKNKSASALVATYGLGLRLLVPPKTFGLNRRR
ncbi:SLAP domain-containing protein [Aquibacillus albus]|uniref:SLAP domain-containing protein n=1 Tax=Aquibacillus albus TaxID=1168171 RepID=A0ABS2MY16_9BACI|nr:SLAP domain-containing protein [Aquibacillus albus]MBM7570760.1 SLAP domain-containing protein [Aquibacillus albus]